MLVTCNMVIILLAEPQELTIAKCQLQIGNRKSRRAFLMVSFALARIFWIVFHQPIMPSAHALKLVLEALFGTCLISGRLS